jgi:hypothetical protein
VPTAIGDTDVEAIEGTMANGFPVKLYFDDATGLLVRQVRYVDAALGRATWQIDYSDYRDVAGVKIPFKRTLLWQIGTVAGGAYRGPAERDRGPVTLLAPMTIGLLGFGEAGFHLARGLRSAGAPPLVAFDIKAQQQAAGDRIRVRAAGKPAPVWWRRQASWRAGRVSFSPS